jgi:hypothetical protein
VSHDLSDKKKKELRKAWAETLPKLNNLKYLMTTHQIDQSFFESICEMKNLEGLYIKWGKVECLDSFNKLSNLKHLYFGSNPRIKSIDGISKLKQLETLEIENFKHCEDLEKICHLNKLLSLRIFLSTTFQNLDFLKELTNLKVLVITNIDKETNIEPIKNLKNLEKLWIPKYLYKNHDISELKNNFTKLKFGNLTK